MNIQQLSVFLENKPGHLQNVLKVLKNENINIMTLTIAEVSDFGILRLLVNKPEKAHKALRKENITCSVNDVLGIAIDDNPGSLLDLIDTFKKRVINIEYMYAFTEKKDNKAVMIFRFEDIEAAKKALVKEGIDIMKKIDLVGNQE